MTEREAFEAWMSDWQARGAFRKPTAAEAWFAACAWQKRKDEAICAGFSQEAYARYRARRQPMGCGGAGRREDF